METKTQKGCLPSLMAPRLLSGWAVDHSQQVGVGRAAGRGRPKRPGCQVQKAQAKGPGTQGTQKTCDLAARLQRGQGRHLFPIPGHVQLYLQSEGPLPGAPQQTLKQVDRSQWAIQKMKRVIFTSKEFQTPAKHWRNKISCNRFSTWWSHWCEDMACPHD